MTIPGENPAAAGQWRARVAYIAPDGEEQYVLVDPESDLREALAYTALNAIITYNDARLEYVRSDGQRERRYIIHGAAIPDDPRSYVRQIVNELKVIHLLHPEVNEFHWPPR